MTEPNSLGFSDEDLAFFDIAVAELDPYKPTDNGVSIATRESNLPETTHLGLKIEDCEFGFMTDKDFTTLSFNHNIDPRRLKLGNLIDKLEFHAFSSIYGALMGIGYPSIQPGRLNSTALVTPRSGDPFEVKFSDWMGLPRYHYFLFNPEMASAQVESVQYRLGKTGAALNIRIPSLYGETQTSMLSLPTSRQWQPELIDSLLHLHKSSPTLDQIHTYKAKFSDTINGLRAK